VLIYTKGSYLYKTQIKRQHSGGRGGKRVKTFIFCLGNGTVHKKQQSQLESLVVMYMIKTLKASQRRITAFPLGNNTIKN